MSKIKPGSRIRVTTPDLTIEGQYLPGKNSSEFTLLHDLRDGVVSIKHSRVKIDVLEPPSCEDSSLVENVEFAIKAVMSLVSYVSDQNRRAEINRSFDEITRGQNQLFEMVSRTLDLRFQESDINDELAVLDGAIRAYGDSEWSRAKLDAEDAADRLMQRDLAVRAAPFFLTAASLAIDAQARSGNSVEVLARDYSNHIESLIPRLESSVSERISVVRVGGLLGRWEYRIDGQTKAFSLTSDSFPNRRRHDIKRLSSPLVPSLLIARAKWRALESGGTPDFGLALAGYRTIGQSTQCAISESGARIAFSEFLAVIEVSDFAVEIPDDVDRSISRQYSLQKYTEVIDVNPYGVAFVLSPANIACFPQGGFEAVFNFAAQNDSDWPLPPRMLLSEFNSRFGGIEKLHLYKAGLEGH